MHTNSKLLFEKYALPLFASGMRVLEIGPDSFPSSYQKLATGLSLDWHTLDIRDNPKLTYPKSDEYSFAIPDGSYDVVVAGQVIEHVKRPWKWMEELARITRLNGLVIVVSPVSWTYHESPVDCWRIYPEGMKALYEDSLLTVLFSRWESLESMQFHRFLPGVSREAWGRKKKLFYDILGRLGLPVERAYDTITVGRKERTEKSKGQPERTKRDTEA